jgi:hypothetical protein
VSVDGNPCSHTERLAEDHLCGLPTDSRETDQCLEISRNLTPMIEREETGRPPEIPGFASVQPRGSNHGLEFLLGGLGQLGRPRPAREDLGRNLVHPEIGALGREHGRDQQLPWCPIVEFAYGLGIGDSQSLGHELGPHPTHPN